MTDQTRIYLAGPMTGHPNNNKPLFDHNAQRLRSLGYHVFNPADLEANAPAFTSNAHARRWYLGIELAWISANADAIAVLADWSKSTGAMAEVALANALNIPVYPESSITGPAFPNGWRTIPITEQLANARQLISKANDHLEALAIFATHAAGWDVEEDDAQALADHLVTLDLPTATGIEQEAA